MDLSLCGPSAFRFYRIPPQILSLYPTITSYLDDPNCRTLLHSPVIEDLLGTPLHRLAQTRRQLGSRKLFSSHLMTYQPPPGAFWQTNHGFDIASPEFTLLNLATTATPIELLMATYELCGSFAVFKPCKRSQAQLDEALNHKMINQNYGWKRVCNANGSPTDLWKRNPLTNIAGIENFLVKASGMRGVKRLRWAAKHMSGITASPFEAQTSILLSMPRSKGGWGLTLQNNVRIPLSPTARKLHEATCAYADILLGTQTNSLGFIIECQGRSIHGSEKAALSDAERATALSSMGYDVIQITYKQIVSQDSCDSLIKLIHKKIGMPFKPKSAEDRAAELILRSSILIDWNNLLK